MLDRVQTVAFLGHALHISDKRCRTYQDGLASDKSEPLEAFHLPFPTNLCSLAGSWGLLDHRVFEKWMCKREKPLYTNF
jgi:hypothetical protein